MNDLLIAKNLMETYSHSIVIVKNEKAIYQSDEGGIKPFLNALITFKDDLAGASVADKIIGMSLANLLVYGKISKVYSELISENAKTFLKKNNITIKYKVEVPFILNKNKDNLCMFESMAKDFTSCADAFEKINNFFLNPKA